VAYCVRADIEAIYGKIEVTKWADLDNDGDTASITVRITNAIARADAQIDDTLRDGPYTVPFTTVPQTIADLSAYLAGVLLYEARGTRDFDPETNLPQHRLHWQRRHVADQLAAIRGASLKLDVAATVLTDVRAPQAVEIEDDYE
jgi:phage gp36-like protein